MAAVAIWVHRPAKLAIPVGMQAPGSVHSSVLRSIAAGATKQEVLHVATLAVVTLGLPAAVVAHGWVTVVLDAP